MIVIREIPCVRACMCVVTEIYERPYNIYLFFFYTICLKQIRFVNILSNASLTTAFSR